MAASTEREGGSEREIEGEKEKECICSRVCLRACVSSEDQMLPVLFVQPCVFPPNIKMTINADAERFFFVFILFGFCSFPQAGKTSAKCAGG